MTPDLLKILSGSGPCADDLRLLRLYLDLLDSPFLRVLALATRLRFTPGVLDLIRSAPLPPEERGALFSRAMNLFSSGAAYKTTGRGRTPLADEETLKAARPGARLLEAGVSDGTSALDLLARANGAEVILSDSQAGFAYKDHGPFRTYYGLTGGCASVKFGPVLFCTGLRLRPPADAALVSALNPLLSEGGGVRELLSFDIFTDRLDPPADAVKCANVLNLSYFPPERIKAALANLRRSLKADGLLVISQTNPAYEGGEAVITLRNTAAGFALQRELNRHELLAELAKPLFSDLVRTPEGHV